MLGYDDYLQCPINILNIPKPKPRFPEFSENFEFELPSEEVLESIFNNDSFGFTISFLAKPHFYKEQGPTVFLSIGEVGEQPVLLLEKPIQ